jgi:hypothetical protein
MKPTLDKLQAASALEKWERLAPKNWKRRFLIDNSSPSLGSWLDESWEGGNLAVGCKCCKFAKVDVGAMANYEVKTASALQSENFLKHESNPKHRAAVTDYINNKPGSLIGAPTEQEFKSIADEALHGHGTCDTLKRSKMTYCLSEGMKSIDQDHAEKTAGVALFRDESAGRLSIRFRTVSQNLDSHSGTMGTAKDFGSGGLAIAAATTEVMERFCSRFHGAPGKPKHKGFVKKHLFNKVRTNTICITVDSAGDEVLASEIMRSSALSNSNRRATPNLKYVIRDKAHGSKRLVSRSFAADPYLKEVMGMFASNRKSIARTIQNSHVIKGKFKEYLKTSFRAVKKTVSNMRSAKHRFESLQKPFGRTVLFLYPTIRTAIWTAQTRDDESSDNAKEWLAYVDNENCVQSSMMADASDQTIVICRIMDDESADPAIVNQEVKHYVRTMDSLFGDDAKCLTHFGYTKAMLDTLKKPLVWTISGGKTCHLGCEGGVPPDIIERCLGRMRCLVNLVKSIVAVEFPSFEIASVAT